jgi:hypothetical protein
MSAQEAATIYLETTIPAGMTMSDYRASRPNRASLLRRLTFRLRPSR